MGWVALWWRQEDHYDWMIAYLKARGLVDLVRRLIATATMTGALIPLALATIAEGPQGSLARVVACAAAVGLGCLGLIWAAGVPSRGQSASFCLGVSGCIGAAALVCRDPVVALLVCTCFAFVGGYIAFVHTAVYAVCAFVASTAVVAAEAVRLLSAGRGVLAACGFWIVVALTVSVPAGIQIIVHSLGIDLLRADSDPLTMTLNRRAFLIKVQELIYRRRETDEYLMLMVLDLDGFKAINDTRGHLAGDRVLATVADVLRRNSTETAVIGRRGGDEFLIAYTGLTAGRISAAERLCQAIVDSGYPITASIGTVSAALSRFSGAITETVVNDLVAVADHHMYQAKRHGGNQASHAADRL